MGYDQKMKNVKMNILSFVERELTYRYTTGYDFRHWSFTCVKEAYVAEFAKEFGMYTNPAYITPAVKDALWQAATHAGYALQTYIQLNPCFRLYRIVEFMTIYISNQLNDMSNWCDDILTAMDNE